MGIVMISCPATQRSYFHWHRGSVRDLSLHSLIFSAIHCVRYCR